MESLKNFLDLHPNILGWSDRFIQPKILIRMRPILARHTVTPKGVALEVKYHWWSDWKVLGKNGKPRLFPSIASAKTYVTRDCPECKLVDYDPRIAENTKREED